MFAFIFSRCSFAQSQRSLNYETVLVKRSASKEKATRMRVLPNGYSAHDVTVIDLIHAAYGYRPDLIDRAPKWAASNLYNVEARIAADDVLTYSKLGYSEQLSLLQIILQKNFGLEFHLEKKAKRVLYLRPFKAIGEMSDAEMPKEASGLAAGKILFRPGVLLGHDVTVSSLLKVLEQQLNQTIIDESGMMEKRNFTLRWTPEGTSAKDASDVEDLPELPTAIKDQLGLQLVSGRGNVEIFTIDRVSDAEAD